MPVGNNSYTILLQAKINEAGFQTYLNSLKNFSIKLNATIAGVTTSVGGTTAATSGATQATQKLTYASREAQTALRAQADAFRAAGNITTEYTDKTGNLVRVVGQFTNVQGEAVTSTSVWSGKTGELDTRLKTVANQLKNTADRTKDFTANIANNILKVIQWAIATAAIYGTLKKIGEGVEYIEELDKSLTNISVVTGMTRDQTYSLARQYNELAIQMGVQTSQVAEGSLEWFRQGKTIEETTELMRSSLMMSKLGNMEAAASTEYLTAILNGFKMQASEAVSVVDRLTIVDNMAATSISELASALERSSNSAQQAGVDFNTLVAYIN